MTEAAKVPGIITKESAVKTADGSPDAEGAQVLDKEKSCKVDSTNLSESEEVAQEAPKVASMEAQITCGICCGILHNCVSCIPCMHNFCAACFSDWLDQPNGKSCPQCRAKVAEIRRNHSICGIVETFLAENPTRRRPDDELKEMDERNKLTDEVLRISRKRKERGDSYSDDDQENSDDDESDSDQDQEGRRPWNFLPAPERCYNCEHEAPDGFKCSNTSGSHTRCSTCYQFMPIRSSQSAVGTAEGPPSSSCPGCKNTCCAGYFSWISRLHPSSAPDIASGSHVSQCVAMVGDGTNLETVVLDSLPARVFSWNAHERQVLERILASKGMTPTDFFRMCLKEHREGKFQLPDALPDASHTPVAPLASCPWLCRSCIGTLAAALALAWRVALPKSELPPEVAGQDLCYWGYNCRTQSHNPSHAARYNHCCMQTKFVNSGGNSHRGSSSNSFIHT